MVIQVEAFKEKPAYPFLKSVAIRAAAICRVDSSKIKSIAIERYEPNKGTGILHGSHKRRGTVIIALSASK